MGGRSKDDREAKAIDLVSIWLGHDGDWLYSWEIIDEAADKGFSRRDVFRYLDWLTGKTPKERPKKLSKKKPMRKARTKAEPVKWLECNTDEGKRKYRYRPAPEYWKKAFKWIRNDREFTKEELKTADAQYIYFMEMASELSKKFNEARKLSDGVEQKARNKDAQGPSTKQRNEMNDKIATMIRAIRLDIPKEYFNQKIAPEQSYAMLRGNVRRAVKAYLDLWLFINQTYGARQLYAKQMLRVQGRVSKLKREN